MSMHTHHVFLFAAFLVVPAAAAASMMFRRQMRRRRRARIARWLATEMTVAGA